MQRPECDCGNGVPGDYNFTNCYGNTFYLGIYGAIGVSVGIFSFTKEMVLTLTSHESSQLLTGQRCRFPGTFVLN